MEDSYRKTIIYTPDGPIHEGDKKSFHIFRLMFKEAVESTGLTWRLFVRDFSVRYRQSLLGLAWAILMPLITVAVFVLMNRSGVLDIGDTGMPYPLYALIGISIWNLFSIGLTACTNALVNAGNMVLKINFPKVSLIFAAAGQGIVDFLIRIVLIGVAVVYYQIMPDPLGALMLFFAVIPLFLLMVGLGFVFALVASVIRDLVHALNIGLMGLMLLTPILYPLADETLMGKMNLLNPLYYLVCLPRNLIFGSTGNLLVGYVFSSILAVGVFFIGWRLYYLAQQKIVERI